MICNLRDPMILRHPVVVLHWYARKHEHNEVDVALMTSVISSVSNLNRWSSSLGLFCHVPLKRDQWDWDWRWGLNDTPNAPGCSIGDEWRLGVCAIKESRVLDIVKSDRSLLQKSPVKEKIFCIRDRVLDIAISKTQLKWEDGLDLKSISHAEFKNTYYKWISHNEFKNTSYNQYPTQSL